MLRSFAGRFLLAAKTSVKEPVKAKNVAKTKVKKEIKVVDTSKFHHNRWAGNDIFQLVAALPKPAQPAMEHRDTWLHKNGHGLKFYRPLWARYPEPCYWTIAKIKQKHSKSAKHARVWGFLTWRGNTEPLPRPIPGSHRKEWRILLEPGLKLGPSADNCYVVPPITLESDAKTYSQLPEDLPGVANPESTWPYPWGRYGSRSKFVREPPKQPSLESVKKDAEAEMDRMVSEDALGERENWLRSYDHQDAIDEAQRADRELVYPEDEDENLNEDEDADENEEAEEQEDEDFDEDVDEDVEEDVDEDFDEDEVEIDEDQTVDEETTTNKTGSQ